MTIQRDLHAWFPSGIAASQQDAWTGYFARAYIIAELAHRVNDEAPDKGGNEAQRLKRWAHEVGRKVTLRNGGSIFPFSLWHDVDRCSSFPQQLQGGGAFFDVRVLGVGDGDEG
ncbi:MAG TPA: hypothetical protein PLC40_09915, partial [Candidatus Hydrogenedentes bacterium]|nr:hypothetical protein [Candidatus Hydrogenedentota bacterium]